MPMAPGLPGAPRSDTGTGPAAGDVDDGALGVRAPFVF